MAVTEDEFLTVVRGNPVVDQVLDGLSATGLKDAWPVAGCLFQTVWNQQTGRPPEFGITDYDVFYFDASDLSWEAEDEAIQRALQELGEVDADIEIRNQARVHLWYEAKFGIPYKPLSRATEGVDRFLAKACMVGVRKTERAGYEVYAPQGFRDLQDLTVRPAEHETFDPVTYRKKAKKWLEFWPELRVIDASAA
ncbi:nucleotidyltransferase family protein [Tritonibacter mobilis]